MESGPRLIFWEITKKCNLSCPYCRREDYTDKGLTLEKSLYIIDSITEVFKPLLVFSGGESLVYPYIFEVANYARKKGLKIALATNGTLIDKSLAKRIAAVDFHRVAISLDAADETINDSLRGKGTFTKILNAIELLKSQGVSIQINTTILSRNFEQISSIYGLCLKLGISALHIFAFVPVGCGVSIPKEERLNPQEYEDFLNEIANLSLKSKIEIKLTCAPQYQRVLSQKTNSSALKFGKGCLAGTGVCFISSQGEVFPCGYLPISAGNILKDGFKKIWDESDLFQTLRDVESLKGKCGICEYLDICGGCRARAYAASGDYLEEETECIYQPLSAKS